MKRSPNVHVFSHPNSALLQLFDVHGLRARQRIEGKGHSFWWAESKVLKMVKIVMGSETVQGFEHTWKTVEMLRSDEMNWLDISNYI